MDAGVLQWGSCSSVCYPCVRLEHGCWCVVVGITCVCYPCVRLMHGYWCVTVGITCVCNPCVRLVHGCWCVTVGELHQCLHPGTADEITLSDDAKAQLILAGTCLLTPVSCIVALFSYFIVLLKVFKTTFL